MAKVPKVLQPHINGAFPATTAQVASVLPNGYAQITMRGSLMVFDDEHIAWWERGKGTTTGNLKDGDKVTVFYRNPKLREDGTLPAGGVARFYGTVKLHKAGDTREQIWAKVVQPEKDRDPEQKGWGVLMAVERAEDLGGNALKLE